MDSHTHIMIATTLSIIATFILYCILEDTRASGFLFQDILIDKTRDQILYTRCWWNNEKINRTCEYFFTHEDKYNIPLLTPLAVLHMSQLIFFRLQRKSIYIRPIVATIICGWLLGRFWDGIDLWYKVDIITIYFLIWQVIFVISKWELKQIPMLSFTFYQGWFCVLLAFCAFTVHDAIFRYLPIQFRFVFFWMFSFLDILSKQEFVQSTELKLASLTSVWRRLITTLGMALYLYFALKKCWCLHPDGRFYNRKPAEELLKTELSVPYDFYSTSNFDDDESDEEGHGEVLGDGDFYFYNLMLLSILPPLSSMTTKMLVTVGYIISVQIGSKGTSQLGRLYNSKIMPCLPLPVVFVSMYALILDMFRECCTSDDTRIFENLC